MPLSVERPEIRPYLSAWHGKPREQVVKELASYSLETHGIPDPYRYYFTPNGELYEPDSGYRVVDTVYDKTSYLGHLEQQAIRNTEKLAAESKEGAIAWISPPYTGVYPFAKIVIHEIEYEQGVKRLFNRAIVLALDGQACMKLAWNLTSYSFQKPIFRNADQIRSTPLMLNTGKPWLDIMESLIDDQDLWESIRRGADEKAKEQAIRQARIVQKQLFVSLTPNQAEMAVYEMLGPRPTNCPSMSGASNRTALGVVSENSLTYYGSFISSKDPDFCRNCPVCGKEINCVVRMGGSCPECGAVKRCG